MKPNNCWGSGGWGHVKLTSDELRILLEVSENEVWQDVQANEKQHANLKQRKEKKKISAIWKHEMIYIYKYTAAWTFNIRRKKAWSWSITELPGFKLNLFQMKIVFSSCISSRGKASFSSSFRNFKIPTLGLHPISLYVRKQCEHSSKLVLLCSTE